MGAILLLHEHGLLPVGQFLEANLFSGQLHGLRDHRDHVRQRVGLRLARSAHGGSFAEQQAAIHVLEGEIDRQEGLARWQVHLS